MKIVRSRLLLGAGAWLIGASMATAGSLYAVGQLGNSLFATPTRPLSVKMVNAELSHEGAKAGEPTPDASKSARDRDGSQPLRKPHPAKHRSSSPTPTPTSSSPAPAGVLLTSADGNAQATCQAGEAFLVYWTAAPGFEADQSNRGPAAVAYVVFSGDNGGIKMQVTCESGVPVEHLSPVRDT